MKKSIIFMLLVLIVSALCLSSCATVLSKKSYGITVSSDPAGADVIVDGVRMGKTPTTISLPAEKSYALEVAKEGYQSSFYTIKKKVGAGWVVLDLVTGIPTGGIPLLVDLITGDWKTLSPTKFDVNLVADN